MKISVFGLGYVGSVSLACLARDGHTVIGVDVDPHKLDLITSGISPVIEEGMPELMATVATCGRMSVTTDAVAALRQSDVSFIALGTPSNSNGSLEQSAIYSLTRRLAAALAQKSTYHLFVYRSTLIPGTVENQLRPLLEELSGKRDGVEFDIAFQPEFLREGSSIRDYDHPPFVVAGVSCERAAGRIREIYGHLPASFHVTSLRTAEMLKACCNNFHALKITFANEVARLCEATGCDPFAVMDLLSQDRQLNISPAYLKPGFAFGGSCLPKDLRAFIHLAKVRDVELPMLASILPSNSIHIQQLLHKVVATGKRSIGLVGLSFKTGTDDLRESPLVTLAEQLIGKGFDLSIYDPEVHLSRLVGANRKHIEQTIPHIGSLLTDRCEETVGRSEVVILGIHNPSVLDAVRGALRPDHVLIDLVHMEGADSLPCRYIGACW